MMDLEAYGILGYIVLIVFIILVRIVAVMIVAGAIATYIGLNGLLWWCSAIVIFLLINAVISGLSK
ncbi:MAG: hypothetical protein IJH12_01930 [Clostridia bacterium]|nr:hypothetical protein [Clostridia bacterium]